MKLRFLIPAATAACLLFVQATNSRSLAQETPVPAGDLEATATEGAALCVVTDEYRFGDQPAVKLTFPERTSNILFVPKQKDWSRYRQLVFTLYNPWNNTPFRTLYLRDGKKVHKLPPEASIPDGLLVVPRETRLTYRLDLQSPSIRELVDLKNITGVYIHKGSPETTYYLDQFRLLTEEEAAAEEGGRAREKIGKAYSRLIASPPPSFYASKATELAKELKEFSRGKALPEGEGWQAKVDTANQWSTIFEALKGERPTGDYAVVTASSMHKIFRDEPLRRVPAALAAAGNEHVSFQAVITPERPLQGVRIEAGELALDSSAVDAPAATIPSSRVEINPVGYVEVRNAFYYRSSRIGWWPDPLLRNQPLKVEDRIQPYWITIHVPADQTPGIYKGQLVIHSENAKTQTLDYRLKVRAFSLPVRGTLQTLLSFTYQPKDPAIRRRVYETLLGHRISPTNIYINAGAQDGYQPAREDLEFCLERGLNTLVLWHPYDKTAPFPYDLSDDYKARMRAFLSDYKPVLEKHDAWKMAMILGWDEVTHKGKDHAEKATKAARDSAQFLKHEFPELRLGNIGGPPLFKGLEGLMNVWIPQTTIVDRIASGEYTLDHLTQNGNELFFYWVYGDPSFMIDLPGMAPRVLSWIAFKYGASGIGYYSTIRSPRFADAPTGVDWPHEFFDVETTKRNGRNGDGSLVYPARDGSILSSIRLANTRDGIQDYEYLMLLKRLHAETGDREAAKLLAIPDALLTHRDYPSDPDKLEAYRRKVAEAIERLSKK